MSTILEYEKEGHRDQKKAVASAQLESTTNPEDRDPFRRRSQLSTGRKDKYNHGDKDSKPGRIYSKKLNIGGILYELVFSDDESHGEHLEQVNVTRRISRTVSQYRTNKKSDPFLLSMLYCSKELERESEWTIVYVGDSRYDNLAAVLLVAKKVNIQ